MKAIVTAVVAAFAVLSFGQSAFAYYYSCTTSCYGDTCYTNCY